GIRDFHVTGVQTCALPISSGAGQRVGRAGRGGEHPGWAADTVCPMEEVDTSVVPHGGWPAAGSQLGGYTVVREIGSGAMGAVYRSEERRWRERGESGVDGW